MSTLFILKPTKISKVINSSRTTCNFQSTKNRPIDHYSLHLPPRSSRSANKILRKSPSSYKYEAIVNFQTSTSPHLFHHQNISSKIIWKGVIIEKPLRQDYNTHKKCFMQKLGKNYDAGKKKVCGPALSSWEEASVQGAEPWDLPHIPNAPGWWWWWCWCWWWWWWCWWWYIFDCETRLDWYSFPT